MAHQLIFTSSVRGIKPGASGYCTVLRSPGIRPSIERALEGFSVFEHIARNVNGSVQSLRHIEFRGVTYYVLSRVSDAGKDYTGRTNFLAHYLVFEPNEFPTVSPVDILLNWSGWCQAWSGEPREEAVDMASFSAVARMQAPATLWQQQPCGVNPAALLATRADMKVLIQSLSLSSAELLQLIGEAFAVRSQLGQDASNSWKTSFAVGLASDSHAKDFTWIGAYWDAEPAILRQRELIDVASPQVNAGVVDEKALAIATTGRYVEALKPIPLTQDPAMRSVLNEALQEQASIASKPVRGRPNPVIRRQARKVAVTKSKKRSKLPMYVGLCVVLLAVGWFSLDRWQYNKAAEAKLQYQSALKKMVDLYNSEGDVTKRKAAEIIKNLAENHPGGESSQPTKYSKLYPKWIAEKPDEYKAAFDQLRRNTYPGQFPIKSVASAPVSSDGIRLENSLERTRSIDGAIVSAKNSESDVDKQSVNDPAEVFKSSPVALPKEEPIFPKQNMVYYTKVGEGFPLSEKSIMGSEVYMYNDFLSDEVLVRSSFADKPEKVKELKIGGNFKSAGLSINGKINEEYNRHAFLVVDEPNSVLILIFGKNHKSVFEAQGRPLPKSNASDAYETIEDQYLVSGLTLELFDVKKTKHPKGGDTSSAYETPPVITSVERLCIKGNSADAAERWFLDARAEEISEVLRKLQGNDKKKEVIKSLNKLEKYLRGNNATVEGCLNQLQAKQYEAAKSELSDFKSNLEHSADTVERWFLHARFKKISDRCEELQGDDEQKEVIASLNELESYLKKSNATLEGFFEKAAELIVEARESSEENSSRQTKKTQYDAAKTELSHGKYDLTASFTDGEKGIEVNFKFDKDEDELTFDLTDKNQGGGLETVKWSAFKESLKIDKEKSAQSLKDEAASKEARKNEYEWSYLEVRDGDTPVAKINLKGEK